MTCTKHCRPEFDEHSEECIKAVPVRCKKCGKITGPTFGMCSDCIQAEDAKGPQT